MPAKFGAAAVKRSLLTGLGLAILALGISAPLRPVTGQAFTLIGCGAAPGTKVTVSPTSGLKSASLKADGVCSPAPCGTSFTFNFYWDTTATLFWSAKVAACNAANAYDTGLSPAFVPPAADNTVGAHKVILNIVNSGTGGLVVNGSQSVAYTISAPPPPPPPPPSPRPQPSPVRSTPPQTQPTPTPTPTPLCAVGAAPAGCPSPSTTACPAAMLPPAGTGSWGDNLIAGLVVTAVLPIAGLALFGPGSLLAFARRRRRLLALLGLAALTALTLGCTTVAQKHIPAAVISPVASPSCSA